MPTNNQSQSPVAMSPASRVTWGQIVKTLATNIDHMRPPSKLQANQPTPFAGGPAPSAAAPLLAQVAGNMANTDPGDVLDFPAASFQALLNEANSGIALPAGVTTVRLIQSGGAVLVVRLPARQALLERENAIVAAGATYRPATYITDWYATLVAGAPPTDEERMAMHDAFVGDYSITHCM